jgi:hypothetical protein
LPRIASERCSRWKTLAGPGGLLARPVYCDRALRSGAVITA